RGISSGPASTASRSATPATTPSSRRSTSPSAATPSSTRSFARPWTRRSARQRLAELDLARDLVGGEVAGAVVDDVFRATDARADDAGDHHRPSQIVGHDPGLRRLHLGERLQAPLDLAQRDALAVDLDEIVLAAGDHGPSRLVLLAQIAGAEPA